MTVKEWPLQRVGEEAFFGYPVGVGFIVNEATQEIRNYYADFHYGSELTRYLLPSNEDLIQGLLQRVSDNVEEAFNSGGTFTTKLWIKRTPLGYETDLP